MPRVFKDPVGWTEKAVGTTGRFVFLCVATVVFWAIALAGMHLAVEASAIAKVDGQALSAFHQGVWALVYITTFVGFVGLPVTYLIALHGLIVIVRTKQAAAGNKKSGKRKKGNISVK